MSWVFELTDIATDTLLLDLTQLSQESKISTKLNRPIGASFDMAANNAALWAAAPDGRPRLDGGTRCIKCIQDGTLRANPMVWQVGPTGDANTSRVLVSCQDPMAIWRRRPVRDSTGNLITPAFADPVSGATMIQDSLDNSITYEGPLLVDTAGGSFDLASPPAQNLAQQLQNWPMMIATLATLLTDTGAVDIVLTPLENAGEIAQLHAVTLYGSDLSGTVHFDYATGDNSAEAARRFFDMDELCNKLYYYLGPKLTRNRWKGNITATETGAAPGSEDLTAYAALQAASQLIYGVYMDIRIFDDSQKESGFRRMFHQLWRQELSLRAYPRELLHITPAAGAGCEFRPFIDYDRGDTVAVNTGAALGTLIAANQRIYGFDVLVDKDGVERTSELVVSAEA